MDQVRHRLEERPEHLAALVADVAHHLELLVDDHEELEDLLLVGEEVEQPVLEVASPSRRRDAERARDRVHPDVALPHRHVPLGAGADEEPLAGEEAEGPVGAALALHQPAQHGERARGVPVGDDRAVVAADDEVGALALADLVADDRLDDRRRSRRRWWRSRRGRRTRRARRAARRAGRRPTPRARPRCRRPSAGRRRRWRRTRARAPGGTARRPAGRRCGRAPAYRSRAGCRAGSPPRGACRRPGRRWARPCAG